MDKQYYEAYEGRYQAVQSVSRELFWGHSPEDEELNRLLADWVHRQGLTGRRIVEFCCGEGGSGAALVRLGCAYQGYDVAPSAIAKAHEVLDGRPNAEAEVRDLVKEPLPKEAFDAALDVMGLHMLVVDSDRRAYLRNMFDSLRPGAPAFFLHQCYRRDAYDGTVASFADWERISGTDYSTPQEREIGGSGKSVLIPLVPARAKTQADYVSELQAVGFAVDEFMEMGNNRKCPFSCSFHVHKPE